MFNNKYVACIDCGLVIDTEEYDYIVDSIHSNNLCGCDVYFYEDSNGYARCGKGENPKYTYDLDKHGFAHYREKTEKEIKEEK